ncbi:putative sugar nucleotidyl transferase [Persicitalea jodogahamensis]|uniref:Glucose-1-phosphate thymidylyltransferase n=1 Tax=Persicitalea jodogahamensis TaxID=402147 RepID=A0A8J3D7C2_9BACT|nr:putative sugar nucleotidyl transferase [Persicitalea jodogahamensis]GHB84415.1 glucose-1-phosphate thymidylyltransferase [Persicitalea jodogahamensis]
MPSVILFDAPDVRVQLLPFTFTRPVAGIRCGILTLAEKWGRWLNAEPSYATEKYLSELFPFGLSDDHLYIDGSLCPNQRLVEVIRELPAGSFLRSAKDRSVLAVRTASATWADGQETEGLKEYVYAGEYVAIRNLWDIFGENGEQIGEDYELLTAGRTSHALADPHTHCYAPENIFIEEGVKIRAAILNAEDGPIFLGRNATVSEGAIIQGPFALGEGAVVGQGAKIRPNTTVGPYCKVGGEVNNSVFFAYSNKGHDGYLGNSVLGEWCNLGANTNNSNLKNDYTNVKLYNYATQGLEDTGRIFCGLFMGDYTKAGISTMFNTGTVVGVNVNVFGAGFQPKHIPSFSWGGAAEGFAPYRLEKALTVLNETMRRREISFDEKQEAMLRCINAGMV